MNKHSEKLFLIFLALVLCILMYTRFTYVHIPFERDEGEYAYAGSLLLHNQLPYQEAYNMKFPGSYFMYALIMKVGGETVEAVRVGITIVILLTALLIGAIAWLFTKSKSTAALAAVTFVLFNNTMIWQGLMANSEHFVNLFVAAGLLFLFLFIHQRNQLYYLFFAGLFLGTGVIMKQYGYPFCIFALLVLVYEVYPRPLVYKLKALSIFAVAGVLPAFAMLGWIFSNGLWEKFKFLTIDYAIAYVGLGTEKGVGMLFNIIMVVLLVLLFLVKKKNGRIMIAWLLFSVLSFSTSHFFRLHYFILAFPAFAVIIAYAYFLLEVKSDIAGKIAVVLITGLFFVAKKQEQFTSNPLASFNKIYDVEIFADMPAIASRVNTFIPAGDKLSMFSNEPEILFYSHHTAASGYIYSYPLFEQQPYAMQMVKEYTQQVEANPSKLFVYSNTLLRDNKQSYQYFENWWKQYSANFDLKGVYYAPTQATGRYVDGEQLQNDSSWKSAPISFEFWVKK